MKKIYAILGGLALMALPTVANAQTLPPASIAGGEYVCSEYGVSPIEIQFLNGKVAELIHFTDVETVYEEWDKDQEYPVESITVTLNMPGGKTADVQLSIVDEGAYGIASFRTRGEGGGEGLNFSTSLNLNINELDNETWPAGEYSFTLEEGIVANADGDTNEEQTLTWTMVNEYATILDSMMNPLPYDPEKGQKGMFTQDELEAVTITFSEDIEYNAGAIVYSEANSFDEIELDEEYINIEGKVITLDLSFLEQGTYNFSIPSNYVVVGDNMVSGSKYFTYIVWNGMSAADVIDGPASVGVYVRNIELSYGENITAVGTFPALNVVAYPGEDFEIPGANISIEEVPYGEGGTPSIDPDATAPEPETMSVLYIDIVELFQGKTGSFEIEIPAGIVKNEEGLLNPAQTIEFRLVALAEDPEISIEANGVVSVVWEDATYISNNDGISNPTLTLPEGGKVELTWGGFVNPSGEIVENEDYNGIDIDISALIDGDGDYELVIPEAYLNISMPVGEPDESGWQESESYINNEIVYTFVYEDGKFAGIKNIEVRPAQNVEGVYNLNGMKLDNNVNALPNGLYIINGKKVIIRK